MKNAPDKLQWHPAFCAAAGLEFHEDMLFPSQVVVTQELDPGEHRSLRILSNHAKKEDIEEFLRNVEEMCL